MSSPGSRHVVGQNSTIIAVVLSGLFLSGALALVYEVCWIRRASYVFGSTNQALSTLLAVFFAGLCLGSHFFGRRSTTVANPLTAYAILEIAVGMWAVLTPIGFTLCDSIFTTLYATLRDTPILVVLMRIVLITLIVLPATVLMGGTLPFVTQHFSVQHNSITRPVGLLYGINTLGAATGCALCGIILIPTFGVSATLYLSGILNTLLGSVLYISTRAIRINMCGSDSPLVPHAHAGKERLDSVSRRTRRCMALLFFLAGFIALGNEILWTRFLTLLVQNTLYTYTMTLVAVLLGIVLGSLTAVLLAHRVSQRALVFGSCQVATGILVPGLILAPPDWWGANPSRVLILSCMLVPAILSGMCFPLAVRMISDIVTKTGQIVGRMGAINTAGGITGSLLIGFVVLPRIGIQQSVLLLSGLSVFCGCVACCLTTSSRLVRAGIAASAAGFWLLCVSVPETKIPEDYLSHNRELVDFLEGANSNVAVVRAGDELQLEVDRLWQGSTTTHHQATAAHIPAILHSRPDRVLVIGLGPGQTASRFLYHDVSRLDCVEIEPALVDLVKKHFDSDWMKDSRVEILIDDGRTVLMHSPEQYDLISIEVGQMFRPGVASFYTQEFYQRARQRLQVNGMICQFVPVDFLRPHQFQAIVATFQSVFPVCQLWYNTSELLLIGSAAERIEIRDSQLTPLTENRNLRRDLSFAYWGGSPFYLYQRDVFLGGFLMGPESIAELCRGEPVYSEDRPFLEYTVSHGMTRTSEVPSIQMIAEHLQDQVKVTEMLLYHLESVEEILVDPVDTDELQRIRQIQRANVSELAARVHVSLGDRYRMDGQRNAAEEEYLKALQFMPGHVQANLNYAEFLAAGGDVNGALPHCRNALETDPESARAHLQLGMNYARLRQYQSAVDALERAVASDHQLPGGLAALGRVLAVTGQLDRAVDAYSDALQLEPGDTQLKDSLAWLLATHPQGEQRNSKRAIDMSRDAVARGRSAQTLDTLAAAYAADGQFEQATKVAGMAQRIALSSGNQMLATVIGNRVKLYERKQIYTESKSTRR